MRSYNDRLQRSNDREMKRIQNSIRTLKVARWDEVNARGVSANWKRVIRPDAGAAYLAKLPELMAQGKVKRVRRRRIKQI